MRKLIGYRVNRAPVQGSASESSRKRLTRIICFCVHYSTRVSCTPTTVLYRFAEQGLYRCIDRFVQTTVLLY